MTPHHRELFDDIGQLVVTIRYDPSVPNSQFRQGEVLSGLLELRFDAALLSEESFLDSSTAPAERLTHPWTIILSPDCDLQWDFAARQGEANIEAKCLSHVLLCDLEELAALQAGRIPKTSRDKDLITQNRNERFHFLPSSETQGGSQTHPDYFVDFKRVFSEHIDYLYAVTEKEFVMRCGFLKSPWVQHLADRFTYFLGRVGLPDSE